MQHQISDVVTQFNTILTRLIDEYGYPKTDIRTNVSIQVGLKRFVVDILVYRKNEPYIAVEVKKNPILTLDLIEKGKTLQEKLDIKYFVLTNGIYTTFHAFKKKKNQLDFFTISDIPYYGKDLNDIGKHGKKQLVKPKDSLFLIQLLEEILDRNSVYFYSSVEKIQEILKIITAKIQDEQSSSTIKFRAEHGEDSHKIKNRIEKLLTEYDDNIDAKQIRLPSKLLAEIVYALQKYSISYILKETEITAHFNSFLRSDKGEFFTPLTLSKFLVELLEPLPSYKMIDLACGSGRMLVQAGKSGAKVVGVDINLVITKLAKMSCKLNGIKHFDIFTGNSLNSLKELQEISKNKIMSNSFDIVLVHPPFGLRKKEQLDDFEVTQFPAGTNVEVLFIERALQLLKPGGKLGIIVPVGIIFNKSTRPIREFIIKHFKILGMISLPEHSFYPHTSIGTSILVLEKSGYRKDDNYQIFTATAKNIGYDRLGQPTEKNDLFKIKNDFHTFLKSGSKNAIIFDSRQNENLRFDSDYFKHKKLLAKISTNSTRLEELAEIRIGIKSNKVTKEGKEFKFVKAQNVKDLEIDISSAEEVNAPLHVAEKVSLENGDIVITRSGTVGNIGIFYGKSPTIISDNIIRIRVLKEKIIPEYLAAFLASDIGQLQIQRNIAGSTIRGISISEIKKITLQLLPIDEQYKIARDFEKILELKRKYEKIKEQFIISRNELSNKLSLKIVREEDE